MPIGAPPIVRLSLRDDGRACMAVRAPSSADLAGSHQSSPKIRRASARIQAASSSAAGRARRRRSSRRSGPPTDRPSTRRDVLLEDGPASLRDVAQECLVLREAEHDDAVLDADRAADHDERLGRRVGADARDDLRPAVAEHGEVAGRGGSRDGAGRAQAAGVAGDGVRGRWASARLGRGVGAWRRGRGADARPRCRGRRVPRSPARRGRRRGPARRRHGAWRGWRGGLGGGAAACGVGRCAAVGVAAARCRGRPRLRDGARPGGAGSGNRASSSWSRRPPTPARLGSMAASRRAAAARAATGWSRARRRSRGRLGADDPGAERRRRPGRGSRAGRARAPRARRAGAMPASASTATRASMKPVDRLGIGEAEQVADARLVELVGRGRQQLVEHRFRVAHAARGESRDEVHRLGVAARPSASRIRRSLPSISSVVRRRTSKRWRRDRIAGGNSWGWVEANMKTTKSGGSSSDFRSAFQASS